MRIAYILSADPFEENGVNKKVKSQVDTWQRLGHDIQIFPILVNEGKKRRKQFFKSNIYIRKKVFFLPKSFNKDIKDFDPDIVYCRFEIYKPFHWSILRKYRALIEINSDDIIELKQLAKVSLRGMIRYVYNLLTRWIYFKYAKGFVFVTYELSKLPYMNKYNKPSIIIPNNLNLHNYGILKKINKGKPKLVFMGTSNYNWHGLDKIIELAKRTENELNFHIIGNDGSDYPKLSNVKFHGYLFREEYEKVIETCDIGISTLSLYKKKMNEANSLKLREYLAYGLPSIIGYNDTAFIGKQTPEWILKLSNTENNVLNHVEEIIKFCKRMKNVIIFHKESIIYIDSLVFEKKKINFFKEIIRMN